MFLQNHADIKVFRINPVLIGYT